MFSFSLPSCARKSLFIFVVFPFLASDLSAFIGTEGASFLELPLGARPAGMGSAYSMLAEDAYAPIWNPAGLAFLDGPQVAGMHMLYLESTSYEFGSATFPLGPSRGIGVSVQYFQPGSLDGTDLNGNPIGTIDGSYANYTLGMAQALGPTVGIGVSGHFVRAAIDDVSAQALAGTGGILYRPNNRWRAALVVANVGQRLKFLSDGDALPLTYRAGVAYHPLPPWTIALEGSKLVNSDYSGHVGVEYETPFGFSVRSGYTTERTKGVSPEAGVSVGASMLLWNQDFAYTWLPFSKLGSGHLISVVWHFGKPAAKEVDTPRLQRPPPAEENDGFTLEEFK